MKSVAAVAVVAADGQITQCIWSECMKLKENMLAVVVHHIYGNCFD